MQYTLYVISQQKCWYSFNGFIHLLFAVIIRIRIHCSMFLGEIFGLNGIYNAIWHESLKRHFPARKDFKLYGSPIFWFWGYLMKVIP